MRSKVAYADIGELGWSLYLSGHLRWVKKRGRDSICVITHPDRFCLYKGMADVIIPVSKFFMKRYQGCLQDGLGLYRNNSSRRISDGELKQFFSAFIPKEYTISSRMVFGLKKFKAGEMIFKPYPYKSETDDVKRVLVFPRCRGNFHSRRNLPRKFYLDTIKEVCHKFPSLVVTAVGAKKGAYTIDDVGCPNFVNLVREGGDLQEVIDLCRTAVAAIGGASSLPKLSLLQGVPTFVIGHERQRVMDENWLGSKIGFYKVDSRHYNSFNDKGCITCFTSFVEDAISDIRT